MFDVKEAVDYFYNNANKAETTLDDNPIIYLKKIGGVPQVIRDVRKKIIEDNNYQDRYHNQSLDDFVLHVGNGKYLPQHVDLLKDKAHDSYEHDRVNWIVSVPKSGGHIICDGIEYIPKLNGIHYIDGKKLHGISMVSGDTPLILYSFGFIKRHIGYV